MTSEMLMTEWYSYKKSLPKSMSTWTRVLTSSKDVPLEFQREFPEYETAFPYTILIPEETGLLFRRQRDADILCLQENRLVFLENVRGKVVSTEFPLDAIVSLEHGRILLNSWLKISTGFHSLTIAFNTVNEEQFLPVIEAIRSRGHAEDLSPLRQVKHQQELAKLGYLWKANFKYFNLSRNSILPGEGIHEVVYQPEIEFSMLNLLKKPVFRRTLTGHLAILTEKEMILIQEVEKTKAPQHVLYGGIFTYFPLDRINRVTFEEKTGRTDCVMTVTLSDTTTHRAEFSSESAVNLELFKDACAKKF